MLSYLYTALKMPNQILLDPLLGVVFSGATCSHASLLFIKVLACYHMLYLKMV